jgi:hypothetical protein
MNDDPMSIAPVHDADAGEELSPYEAMETAAVVIAAVGLSFLAILLLFNAPRLHRGMESYATTPRIQALSTQTGGSARSGLTHAASPTTGAAAPAPEADNWMDACEQRGQPAAKPPETPAEYLTDVYKFAVRTNCVSIVTSVINMCFLIAGLLLILAVLLYALSKALEAAERKCKKRKKKKKSGWRRFVSWIISLVCALVTVLKWITLILAVIAVIASIVLFVYCIIQVILIVL